ncbi:DEAD/DEAH box helicase [Cohnella abietis]|uniref:DEAD/DEAH box helicase n=1 Tax=Cohnella abietis TaxID=2507935 RepID=A0A3T1D802_9BACL|nr:DEAD/DEAH box helicase [Cohnella abietis]BBI34212.1 DEAD/DEAH box helicase [Cohnella abietis]
MKGSNTLPFHPVISSWFTGSFGDPTDVQLRAWESIMAGQHTLIAAPTGSGKTLAALLPCLDNLVRSKSPGGVRILYLTPLKALNNDIHHHALQFVEQLDALAMQQGAQWPGIRCEVRTGDTSQSKRASILRNPPDLLITTPESLFLLLTSVKGRAILENVEQVIVDEIHDLAADKRGSHLSLTLERLAYRCARPLQRIGVSATQKPLERVARFLGGWELAEEPVAMVESIAGAVDGRAMRPRPVKIVESTMSKSISVLITMPDQSRPAATREAVWLPLLDRIVQAIEGCRSVLIFVNSRRLCERLCLRLNDHVGYEMARSHHGSISRERRLEVESMLKEGSLRCIVATSSLELGIDVGHIDLVIQIDSPQEAARGIQRIGRAGHAVGEASQGVIIARQKAVLPELAVLGRQIALRQIEDIRIPHGPMDVLSQQVVAMVAMDDWDTHALHRLILHSDSYHDYSLARYEEMLQVLGGFYPFVRPLIEWERDTNQLRKRSNTAMASITGAGTIPQSGGYPVHHLESRAHLGELDEEFIQESRVGDVFQLGTSSWMIRDIRNDRVYVSEAGNRFSEIPFWRNEAGSRSYELGRKIGEFLRTLSDRMVLTNDEGVEKDSEAEYNDEIYEWLQTSYGMDRVSSEEMLALVRSQHRACALPTDKQIVIEYYRDVMNQTHVIIHNHCGRTVNRAWLLAIERKFEQLLPYKLYGNAKDNGIELVIPEWDASWLQMINQVTPANLEQLLTEAITGSPLLGIAFRRIAETSLLLSRSFTRTPMWQKRLRSEELLRGALPYAEHFPYLREAMSECLHDYLGYEELKYQLEKLVTGEMSIVVRETPFPSPFAAQFLADYVNMRIYEGDGLDETIRLQLLNVSKELAGQLFDISSTGNAINDEVIEEQNRAMNEPELSPRNTDELATLLKRRGDLTANEIVKLAGESALSWLQLLHEQGRAISLNLTGDGEFRWISSDEREVYADFPETATAITFVIGRYVDYLISFTEAELCERYPSLTLNSAKKAVEQMLENGMIERAPHAATEDERLWTSSKVASRLVRLSIRHARNRADPVEPARWCSQIAFMQHALQGTQQQGSEGLLTVIERLQGLFLPLSHWESIIFPSRVSPYRKEHLDTLCASGEVLWMGRKEEGDKEGKVAFFLTESKPLYAPFINQTSAELAPCKHPRLLELLEVSGATFLTRLSREMDKPPTELLADLLELVWEGRVSNDQFAPLRLQINKKQANWAKTGSGLGRWYATSSLQEDTAASDSNKTSDSAEKDSPVLIWTHHLLKVYGLINKELIARASPFTWDTCYPVLKRLEEWGVLTRGAFIRGIPSLQFTTRELNDSVRQPLPDISDNRATILCSADPANPYGLMIDWPQGAQGAQGASGTPAISFSRKPGNFLLLKDNQWVLWIENNGRKVYQVSTADENEKDVPIDHLVKLLQSAFQTIIQRRKIVKLKVEMWNGEPIIDTEMGKALMKQEAERDLRSLVFWST